ncbi:MAG: TetR/AcrR family transcriptional regulator [Thermodesulfobacteriota bacterium]
MGRTSEAKEKLINSAINLIGQRSYSSVGVQELCEHAGVKKGSFYHFFDSKKELTILSLDVMWKYYKENCLIPLVESDLSLEEKFNSLLNTSYEMSISAKECNGCMTGCPFGNLALELSTQEEDIRLKIEEVFSDWISCFEDLIKKSVERGELPENVNTHATAQSIIAYMEGLALIGKTFNDPEIVKNLGCVVKNLSVCSCEEI